MIEIKSKKDMWERYVPTFSGNKELPEHEQISCEIKKLTQADSDRLQDALINQARKAKSNKIQFSKANREITNSHVRDIKNVFLTDENGQRKELKELKDLYEIPELKGLYEELTNALDASNDLTEEDKKN